MVKFSFLVIIAFFFCDSVKAQNLISIQTKSKIDSIRNFVYTGPSVDLLPAEFNSSALENEYYCDSANYKDYVFVLRLRDNHAFISETYYKPYNWARIQFLIGNYRISGDTVYIKYKPLLKGNADQIYLSPILHVSWIPPRPPEYLLLIEGRLFDPSRQRPFYALTDKPQFVLKRSK
jgi:hypothetical protein